VPDACLLEAIDLTAGYGSAVVLNDVRMSVQEGEVIAILGANGAGKSSLLRALVNQIHQVSGDIRFEQRSTKGVTPAQLARRGLVLVPEGRGLIPFMTVEENLQLGLDVGRSTRPTLFDDVMALFPQLQARTRQRAGDLSGGEQQMLAIARALLMEPRCLMLDEPSEGLAPKVVTMIFDLVNEIRERFSGTIILVEQNVRQALRVAGRVYVLERGRIVLEGTSRELQDSPEIRAAYLGGAVSHAPRSRAKEITS
jgi:branched-chain amino acid transport system ATP-binding protein